MVVGRNVTLTFCTSEASPPFQSQQHFPGSKLFTGSKSLQIPPRKQRVMGFLILSNLNIPKSSAH
jgi:hypothetical protein